VPPIRLAGDFPTPFTAARFQPVTRLLYRYLSRCSPGRCRYVNKDTASVLAGDRYVRLMSTTQRRSPSGSARITAVP